MFPANSSASYLACSSKDDIESNQPGFNPCDFNIVVPNSIKLQDVVRVSVTSVEIPRLFFNVTPFNNKLFFFQRLVHDVPADPGFVFRTVNPNWVLTDSITLTPGIVSNIQSVLDEINAHRNATLGGVYEIWSYDTTIDPNSVRIDRNNTHWAPIVFGRVPDVPPPQPFAVMTWVTASIPAGGLTGKEGSGSFDLLGLRDTSVDLQSYFTQQAQLFDPNDPNSFGSFNGLQVPPLPPYDSNLQGLLKLPLFEADVFDYNIWATTDYATPPLLPPNFAGPNSVYVTMSDLGDLSTVYAKTGTNYDVITTVSLSGVDPGQSAFKEIKDGEYEAIGLKQSRNITGFKIRVLDNRFQQCFLPANFPVSLRVQLVYISR